MRIGLVLLAIALVLAGVWWGERHPKGGLELSQAPVWAALQTIEAQHRGDSALQVPALLTNAVAGNNDVVGLRSDSARFPYVWIVLTTNAGANGIYALPHDANFTLACSDVRSLQSRTKVDPVVVSALQAHCRD